MTAPAPRTFNIVVLPGDGVGPEVALAAQRVLTDPRVYLSEAAHV